jgi:hypothetical protein
MTKITSCVYYPPEPTYDKLSTAGFQPAQEPPRWRRYVTGFASTGHLAFATPFQFFANYFYYHQHHGVQIISQLFSATSRGSSLMTFFVLLFSSTSRVIPAFSMLN